MNYTYDEEDIITKGIHYDAYKGEKLLELQGEELDREVHNDDYEGE